MTARTSLAKDLYDATSRLRAIKIAAQSTDQYEDQRVTREAIRKLQRAASDLAAWLYRCAE